MLELMRTTYDYNTWATARVLDGLEGLTEEEYNAPDCSGNGSIRDTLAHLLTCQWGWFAWFDGSMTLQEAYALTLPGEAIPTVAEARARWAAIDAQTQAYLRRVDETTLEETRSWTTPGGRSDSAPLWKLLLHVANHGTHTRGQVVAGIRRVGADPGNTDLLHWALAVEQARA
jgi:uncharacterized damage-inducible protein DinB